MTAKRKIWTSENSVDTESYTPAENEGEIIIKETDRVDNVIKRLGEINDLLINTFDGTTSKEDVHEVHKEVDGLVLDVHAFDRRIDTCINLFKVKQQQVAAGIKATASKSDVLEASKELRTIARRFLSAADYLEDHPEEWKPQASLRVLKDYTLKLRLSIKDYFQNIGIGGKV